MTIQIEALLQKYQNIINQGLAEIPIPGFPSSLYSPLNYSLQTKGKRIRPIMTLLVGEGFGVDREKLLPAALAVEILHTYTLVHDDIMDNDEMRRGQLTVHKKWDVNTAILSGDAINTLAFRILMNTNSSNLQKIGQLFTDGMMEICEGQALDMEFENRMDVTVEEYITMITKKTAVLLAMSCKIGGLIADIDDVMLQGLENFAIKTGQAFQIQDDLLEILSDQQVMGKSLGSDFAAGKKTYPMLLTLADMEAVERKEFLTFLKNNSNILEVRERFYKSGSIDKATQTVNNLITEAKSSLDVCPATVRDTLKSLLQFLEKENHNHGKKEITINNKHGIHTRPATVFVENAAKFKCDVFITYNEERVNGKSIMGLLILAVEPGATIELETDGPDEAEAMEKFIDIIENNFYTE